MKNVLVLGATALVFAVAGCTVPSSQTYPSDTTGTPSATATAQPVPQQPEAPKLTASQQNAVETAESYIESGAFSKKGLIDQLKYEKYSTADATFAVEHINVDWNEQAAKSAASYLESSSFSKEGLVDQLKYEGFTESQARYGVRAAGL
jgi:hypothetical protein